VVLMRRGRVPSWTGMLSAGCSPCGQQPTSMTLSSKRCNVAPSQQHLICTATYGIDKVDK
jgi:hypothetical protein